MSHDQFPHDDVDDRSDAERWEEEAHRLIASLEARVAAAERGCRTLRHELEAERRMRIALEPARQPAEVA